MDGLCYSDITRIRDENWNQQQTAYRTIHVSLACINSQRSHFKPVDQKIGVQRHNFQIILQQQYVKASRSTREVKSSSDASLPEHASDLNRASTLPQLLPIRLNSRITLQKETLILAAFEICVNSD
ncbi:Hypothetical_protein [Hexamita inflata]|uniref:Hypothetical_protein n=1 Tax=Hexamita inflata TaxID=28002 RepID=A0ABP1JA24_9EUKA